MILDKCTYMGVVYLSGQLLLATLKKNAQRTETSPQMPP